MRHPALPQRRIPVEGSTPELFRARQDKNQSHIRHRCPLLDRLAESLYEQLKKHVIDNEKRAFSEH